MKKIFFMLAIGAFSFASAQSNNLDTFWIKTLPKPEINSELPQTYTYNYWPQVLDQAKLLHTLPNGSKVYALPQDNMPCVAPDMTQFTAPTVKPNVPLNSIPNPSLPPYNTPKVLPQEQLNKLFEMQKQHK